MKGYSAQQIRDAEAPHLAAGEPLMARASAALAYQCERVLMDSDVNVAHARAVVLVGGGKPALPRGVRLDLELLDHRHFDNGVIYVRHAVRNPA